MDYPSVLILSVGLAMDATAVSAARGIVAPRLRARDVAAVAVFFGGFQAGMPLAGWALGQQAGAFVAAWTHWIGFALLAGIGLKMLRDARGDAAAAERRADGDPFGLRVMLVLAVATSIDAFVVGIALPMLDAPFVVSVATIGATTAVLSALGLVAGRRLGAALGRRLEILGGLALIGIGAKILIERLEAP